MINKVISWIFAALMGLASLAMLFIGFIKQRDKVVKAENIAEAEKANSATLERINEATANSPDADGALERMRKRRDSRLSDL